MKLKSKLNLILILVLVFSLLTPTFAWYTQSGYASVGINFNGVATREASSFSVVYGLREICPTQTAKLMGIMPGTDYGTTALEDDTGFSSDSEWFKNNSGATRTINRLVLSDELESESNVRNVLVLSGQLGSSVTQSGAGGAGGGATPEKTDPSDPADNEVKLQKNVQKNTEKSNYTLLEGEPTVESGEADNRLSISGNFSEEADKMVGMEVSITPKNAENVFDIAAANAVSYAIYTQLTNNVNGEELLNEPKVVFSNNNFSYYDANNSNGESGWAKAVAQNGYFEVKKGETLRLTVVVWLDGFADAKAEAGAFNFKVNISDYGNITTQSVQATDSSSSPTGTIQNKADLNVANLVIPEAYYCNGRVVQITKIASNAFKGNANIRTAVIPDAVLEIGSNAFCDCTNLTVVTIGNTCRKIGYNAFLNCPLERANVSNPYDWKHYKDKVNINLQALTPEEIAELLTDRSKEFSNVGSSTVCDWYKQV